MPSSHERSTLNNLANHLVSLAALIVAALTGCKPGPASPPRTLHYTTGFTAPELRVAGANGYTAYPLTRESPQRAVARAFAPHGDLVRFYLRDATDGREDHPPGGGDYLLDPDLDEAWLEKSALFDVDPATLNIDMMDAHTHPYQRTPSGFIFDPSSLLTIVRPFGFDLALFSFSDTLAAQRTQLLAVHAQNPWLLPLVWVTPQRDTVAEVEALLDAGFRGLKFHPTRSAYPADGPLLDPFLELCARRRVPIQIHSALDDNASIMRIITLAVRHPTVPIILVHTNLGQLDKTSTLTAIAAQPNLYAETSWTNPETICQAMGTLGGHRLLLGTDATTDGLNHYTQQSIANPIGSYVYNYGDVLRIVRTCGTPEDVENWSWLTMMRLYRLRFAR